MAYVPVPKDLTRVKTKFLLNLTKRQVVCFGLGALAGVPLFFLTKGAWGSSLATLMMIAIMLPFFLFALYEKNGQPMEVVLRHILDARFLKPKKRIYQTENFYAVIDEDVRIKKEVKKFLYGKTRGQKQRADGEPHEAREAVRRGKAAVEGAPCEATDAEQAGGFIGAGNDPL